ncbi:hypothetical protein GIB67_003912 [Kingdonia uniflora]|uniref:Uncharacterized protein n=1 Tax=Kingdonia uniflora TaxID=39325 RepID=A0A7J7LJW2_9MAGN|nr:hypothetical protein GIB67_003912 [Kingdonia uniflora]
MFYFFFESRTKKDPVVLWLTRGLGCSSELAAFYENGPFNIAKNLSLVLNEYGWDQALSYLYVDQPTKTSFSYSFDNRDLRHNEDGVSNDLYDFLQFGDVDFNDESAPQRNDLRFGYAEESLGAQPTEGDPVNEENVEAPPMADPPQTEEPDCLRVHHHALTWHLEKESTIVRDLVILADIDSEGGSLEDERPEKATECEELRVRIELMKKDIILNDIVHEQYVKSFEKLPARLEEKRRECKLLQDINAKLAEQSERQHPDAVPEAWRQAMKKEFHSGELVEKDDPTFIELFDQYDKFYTIEQQRPKGDYQEDFTAMGKNQDKLMEVRRVNVVLKKKINETLFQLHMGHFLATCYEKVVAFISNHEAYTFLLLFWLRKNNHISNEKRFENLVGDTTKFWWVGLGSDKQYVRLFTRYGAQMPPASTLRLAHVDLGLRGDFQRDMVQKWFGVTNKLFKVLLKENNVKG